MSPAEIEANLKERRLIEPRPMVAIVQHKLDQERKNGHNKFIVDGFPRSEGSAKLFEGQVRPKRPI